MSRLRASAALERHGGNYVLLRETQTRSQTAIHKLLLQAEGTYAN